MPRPEQATACVTVLTNLDGWYDFDGLSSPTPAVGGLGPDAVWFGRPETIAGQVGSALRFDGSSFLEVTNSTAFNYPTQNFSVSVWIRTTAAGATFLDKRCLGTAGGCSTPQGWALAVSPVGYLQLLMGSALPYFYEGFSAYDLKKINDGEWHFVSVSVDRMAARVVFAIDPQSESDYHLVSIEGYAGAILSVRPLRIGGDQTSAKKFVGDLDEVQIYGRALGMPEVLGLQTAGPGGQCRPAVCSPVTAKRSLVGWYSFEETSGVIWQDRAGQNNYLSGTAEQVAGQTGSAAQFGRVLAGGGLRTFDGAPELDMGTGNFTLAAWIRYFPSAANRRAIIDKQGDDAGTGGGYALLLDGGYLRLSMTAAGMPRSAASTWVASRTRLDDGTWHHVAAVMDRTGATPELYVDGKLESQGASRGVIITANINSRSPLNVGGFGAEVSETAGAVDELVIFNSALSAGEVQTMVDAGGTGYCRRTDQGCIAPPLGMISWYRFENATGAFDDAGIVPNEPLVVAGDVSRGAGRVGRGVRLSEGTNSLRTLGATPKLNFDTGAFSFSFWMQPGPDPLATGAASGVAGSRTILEKMTYTSPPNTVRATQGYRLRLVNGRLELALASGGNLGIWTGSTTLRANLWAMISVTIPRDADPRVYLNGRAESLAAAGIATIGTLATPSPVVVGVAADLTLNPSDPMAFDFDELSFYSRVLSLAEVQALAQANVGQCFEGLVFPVKPVFEVSTNPANIGVTVGVSGDSSAIDAYATTIAPSAVTATPPYLLATLPNGTSVPGTEYRFRDWSLNGEVVPEWTSLVQTVPLPTQATTYTANYDTYHQITVTVTGNCRVTPLTGFYLAGSSRPLTITLAPGWVLNSATFTSGASVPRALLSGASLLPLTAPSMLAVACRDATLFPITVSTSPANVGLQVIADGNQVNNSQTFSWPSFPARVLSVFPLGQVVGLTQYTFRRWRNAATNAIVPSTPTGQIVVLPTAAASYIADFDRTAFQILVRQTVGCTVSVSPSPNSFGFYPAGTRLAISSSASSGYVTGPLTIQPFASSSPIMRTSPTEYPLDGPVSISGQCDAQVTTVRFISAPTAARLSMTFLSATNGTPLQVQGLSPVSIQVSPGSLTLTAEATTLGTDGAIRRFLDITPGNLPNGAAVAAPTINTTYTANYDVHCYYVNVGVQPANGGSYSVTLLAGEKPYLNAECYTPGSVLAIDAFPRPGFRFVQWIGDAGLPNPGNPTSTVVTVNNKALSITAIFR